MDKFSREDVRDAVLIGGVLAVIAMAIYLAIQNYPICGNELFCYFTTPLS